MKHERSPSIGQMMKSVIKYTQDPFAPIVIQEASAAVQKLGKMLAKRADQQKLEAITNRLLQAFPDEVAKDVAHQEEFIMALSAALHESLILYVRRVSGDPVFRRKA